MKELDEAQDTHVVNMPQLWLQEININIEDMKHIMYTNQAGKFPVVSSLGNRYIMVLYKVDVNLILVEPMKNRTSRKMCKAYERLMQWLHQSGIKIKKCILDNEVSEDLLKAIQ